MFSNEEKCVAEGTWVTTDCGTFKIEDIVNNKMNVKVLSVDPYGRAEYKSILGYQQYSRKSTVKITFKRIRNSDAIYCTPTRRLLTDKGFKLAMEVGYGDSLMTIINKEENGKVVRKLSPIPIVSISNGKEIKIYNLEIEDNHTFLTNGIVSHDS